MENLSNIRYIESGENTSKSEQQASKSNRFKSEKIHQNRRRDINIRENTYQNRREEHTSKWERTGIKIRENRYRKKENRYQHVRE